MNLSASNTKIINLIAEGFSDKQIAEKLEKKKGTISRAIERLLKRFECKNRTELVVKALLNQIKDAKLD